MSSTGPAPLHPLRLLEVLAQRATEAAVDVTVYLASGRELEGRLLGFEVTPEGPVIALALGRGRDAQTHVAVAHVHAVTVHDAAMLRPRSIDDPIPGRHELRHALAEASAQLAEQGVTLAAPDAILAMDDRARAAVAASLPAIVAALHAVLADALGRAAMAGVTTIRLLVDQQSLVARQDDVLAIHIARAARDRPASWRVAIDAAL